MGAVSRLAQDGRSTTQKWLSRALSLEPNGLSQVMMMMMMLLMMMMMLEPSDDDKDDDDDDDDDFVDPSH